MTFILFVKLLAVVVVFAVWLIPVLLDWLEGVRVRRRQRQLRAFYDADVEKQAAMLRDPGFCKPYWR